uniref:Phosphate-regulating neutral endopeptidase (inferred by orthology to a human protein) n=1 Tax=Strongyloides venezuelensis TaxID=75913 RepID=A0A0K0G135_STRVS
MNPFIIIFYCYALFSVSQGNLFDRFKDTLTDIERFGFEMLYKDPASRSLYEFLDLDVEPCDNFYKFTCGNWIKTMEKNRENSERFNYDIKRANFDKLIKETMEGKYNNESSAIKKIYNLRKKCMELSEQAKENCIIKIESLGKYAFTSLFIKKSRIDSDTHDDYIIIEDIIKRIKDEFRLLIDERENIFDKDSRDNLLQKLNEIKLKKKFELHDTYSFLLMETCYKNIGISGNEDIEEALKNIESLSKMNYSEGSCGRKIFQPHEYVLNYAHQNVEYHFVLNKLRISPNALEEPWFNRYFPQSLNYGNIGSVIANAILNAFNSNHYKYIYGLDKKGNVILTSESIKNFEKKSDCFVKQYGAQIERITGQNVNGSLTLAENIADNGGLKIAHRAFMKYLQVTGGEEAKVPGFESFTSEQLFFISFGRTFCEHKSKSSLEDQINKDKHAPGEIRTIIALSNYKPFSNAFKCKLNTTMNPEHKCEVWKIQK